MSDEDADSPDERDIIDVEPSSDADESDRDAAPEADDSPLGDLASEVRARREARAGEGPEPGTDLFESVETPDIDSEAIWEAFIENDPAPEERLGLGADVQEAEEADEHVVPKREFCQQCPHFTEPPETACTHEGTTIVEVVDDEHFRVRNCPVVDAEPGASPTDREVE
ncbi:hypothetical protein [Haloplanus halobius]|uniref:hypothetical protein n=1 Tax=Haloplanus halobius TaxID=2934938 RepID=UPI00200E8074|nr:hypothetical protein [Haloplanus sp. XH21]